MMASEACRRSMRKQGQTRTLVMLPGLDGTEVFFEPLLKSLPQSFQTRLVCFPTSGSNQYADLLRTVRAAVADLSDYYLVAWSFSGPLALMLGAAEPTRVRGVILFASFVRPPLRCLSVLRFGAITPVVWTIRFSRRLPVWLGRSRCDPLRRAKAELWKRIGARVLAERVRAIIATDASEFLRRCQAPILYVAGNNDKVVPWRNASEIIRVKPSTRVHTIAGGHFAIYHNPAAGAEAIRSFVDA